MSKEKAMAILQQAMGVKPPEPVATSASPEAAIAAESKSENEVSAEKSVDPSPEEIRAELLATIRGRKVKPVVQQDQSEAEMLRLERDMYRRQAAEDAKLRELIQSGRPREALDYAKYDINRFTADLVNEDTARVARENEEYKKRLDRLEKAVQEKDALAAAKEQSLAKKQRLRERYELSGISKSDEIRILKALHESPDTILPYMENYFDQEGVEPEPEDIFKFAKAAELTTRNEVLKLLKAGALDPILESSGWSKKPETATSKGIGGVPNGGVRHGTASEATRTKEERRERALMRLRGLIPPE